MERAFRNGQPKYWVNPLTRGALAIGRFLGAAGRVEVTRSWKRGVGLWLNGGRVFVGKRENIWGIDRGDGYTTL